MVRLPILGFPMMADNRLYVTVSHSPPLVDLYMDRHPSSRLGNLQQLGSISDWSLV
jgi:hypothetical protein